MCRFADDFDCRPHGLGTCNAPMSSHRREATTISHTLKLVRHNRYDHLGRRVQKITPEATHTYFYDGWMLIKEVVERSGDTRRCGVSPRHCGGAGSSTSLGEDAAGSRVSIEEDVIFGKLIASSGPMANVFSLRYSTALLWR